MTVFLLWAGAPSFCQTKFLGLDNGMSSKRMGSSVFKNSKYLSPFKFSEKKNGPINVS